MRKDAQPVRNYAKQSLNIPNSNDNIWSQKPQYYKQGKAIKQLVTIEYYPSLNAAIKHHFNPSNKSSLSKIKIPADNDD